jgi:transcriptional regulator with XRE-family HTH domain
MTDSTRDQSVADGRRRFARGGEKRTMALRDVKPGSESGENEDSAPHPIDSHVGTRIRLRRAQLGLSQSALAARIGMSFQAVQKYETGAIRISASRLYEMAAALQVSPGFFFEEYAGAIPGEVLDEAANNLGRREILSLVRGYYAIRDPELQAQILKLIARLGKIEILPSNS